MKAKPVSSEEQLRLITECRCSGLSDYQWCQNNGIKPGTFYNWISRLRKNGAAIPHVPQKAATAVVEQSVVKMDLVSDPEVFSLLTEKNACKAADQADALSPAMEILIGRASIRFFGNGATHMLETTLKCLGGAFYAG